MSLLQQDEFLVSRIAMDEGVARDYSDNDFILLSKDDPNVSIFDSLSLHSSTASVSTTVIACKASVKGHANVVTVHSQTILCYLRMKALELSCMR